MTVELVAPKEGAIAFKTTIHVVKNSPNKELAFKLIEASLSPEVQTTLMNSPYLIVPTNSKVPMGGEIARAGERHRRTEEKIRVSGLEEDQRAAFRLDRTVQPRNQALRITTMAAASVPRDVTSYGIGLAAPLALFFLVFFVAPLVQLFVLSLHNDTAGVVWGIGEYVHFLTDPFSLSVLGSTLLLGAEVTALCLVLAFHRVALPSGRIPRPDAYHPHRAAAAPDECRRPHLCLDRDPGSPGHNQFDAAFDRCNRHAHTASLHPGGGGLALAQVQMPLMTLPLITALGRIDMNLEDASCSLGAGSWRTFWRVVLPLALPGVIAGCTLTYAAAITAFITQSLVGGGQMLFMPMYLYQQASTLHNWPFASAISIIFLLAVLAVVTVFGMLGRLRADMGEPDRWADGNEHGRPSASKSS